MEFTSTHNLPFLSRYWENPFNDQGWQDCMVGTCQAQWRATPEAYEILSLLNHSPGNGHFIDLMEWFENSCRRDGKPLIIREVSNRRLAKHLLEKGFTYRGKDDLIKRF